MNQQQVAALLIKVAVSASIASILMRFSRIQRILLRDERTVSDRVQLAFIFSVLYAGGAAVRILSHYTYPALDLALEGAIIAGMLGGYVSGLVTGLCVSIPEMIVGKYMSMPLYAACGVLGAIMHDLAPRADDVWYFSPFVDLNLWRFLRQVLRWHPSAIQRQVAERAAFNIMCNAIVVVAEFLRWGINAEFERHGTFFLFNGGPLNLKTFAASAATTLFAVSLPIRIWSSFRAERLVELQRASLTEARLAALTNQINPHFLFNTLNSVSTLIRIDPDRARSMVYKLSSILRRLLRKTDNFSPLRDEVAFIDDYLAIEMTRFGDKLRFYKDIDPETVDRLIPSMILQPIIENSVRHGLAARVDGGAIWLRARAERGRLLITVEDDGIGIEQAKLAHLFDSGIGVSNVNERLRVLFGTDYRLTVESDQGRGTRTVIDLPELDPAGAGDADRTASGSVIDRSA
jgi:two-component system LytT family sensor kinase